MNEYQVATKYTAIFLESNFINDHIKIRSGIYKKSKQFNAMQCDAMLQHVRSLFLVWGFQPDMKNYKLIYFIIQ